MKPFFRQSVALVHTWSGLLVGWVLFFVFLTGTLGYVNHEIDTWMTPERPVASPPPAAAILLDKAQSWLHREVGDAQSWYVFFPASPRNSEFSVGWRPWPEENQRLGRFQRQMLNPSTGENFSQEVRETGGGDTLYAMHYRLHYLPYDWAIRIVGICSMFMLVALISGVIVHKKIFKDFFSFRPGKGQRSWLDGHNLMSVTALPFHLMITWSGLIFFMFTYVPTAADMLYPKGEARDRFYADVSGEVSISPGTRMPFAPPAPLEKLLARAERDWGTGEIQTIRIESPGRLNAQVLIYARQAGVSRVDKTLLFNGVTGELLSAGPQKGTITGSFEQIMLGLHEGLFAGPILRLLYVIAGFAGTAMIATGLMLWSTKRRAKMVGTKATRFGPAAVDILNLGTMIGLPIGVAAYFWANRLLPVGMEHRAEWEVHTMFIAWGAAYLYAIWRSGHRAWAELCCMAAAAYGLIPILNALTTDRGLITAIATGDWVIAGFDIAAFVVGVFFAFLVVVIRRKRKQPAQKSPEPPPSPRKVEVS